MTIDVNTVNVLKNFASINPSILVQVGNQLRTVSPSRTIVAKATVPYKFSKKFAIYDLNRFISTLSLFNNPNLDFEDKFVSISDDSDNVSKYTFADEQVIIKAPKDDPTLPSVDVKFTLTDKNLKDIEKALAVLSLPEIIVSGDGSKIRLQAVDSKNPLSNVFSMVIGQTTSDFKVVFKMENIKIMAGDYEVTISKEGISHFKGKDVEYYIAVEANSTF